ncbi:MAG TPA: hypothetical protein PLQ95_05600 [Thiobacillus sp.]|nr:hypothetical protein [Thiobacillus sp.]
MKNSASAEATEPCCAFASRFGHRNPVATPGYLGFDAVADMVFPEFRLQAGLLAEGMWIVEVLKEKASAIGEKMGFKREGNRNGGYHGFRRNTFSCASGAVHAYFRAKPAPAFQGGHCTFPLEGSRGMHSGCSGGRPCKDVIFTGAANASRTWTSPAEKSRSGN